jgi:hypothetical protein
MSKAKNELYDLMMNNGSFKIIDVDDLHDGILGVEKLARFIKVVRETSNVLGESTYKKVNGSSLAISRLDMARGILTPGRDAAGAKRAVPDADLAGADIATNSLVPKELIAELDLDYDVLEYNLEQDAFENTLMDLFGTAATEDLERYFMFATTDITWGGGSTKYQKLLSINDGWLKTAGNQIYGEDQTAPGTDTADFDPDDSQANWPLPLFDALVAAIPKKYIAGQRPNFRFYVQDDVENAYADLVAARPTAVGDAALLGKDTLTYKKIPVVAISSFDDPAYTALCGQPAMLTKPSNMYWGTKRSIMVENDKDIKLRQLINVLSMSGDCTYEDENATAVAWLDQEKPAS